MSTPWVKIGAPIGGHVTIEDGTWSLRGLVRWSDGSPALDAGPMTDAESFGAGRLLLGRMPPGFLG